MKKPNHFLLLAALLAIPASIIRSRKRIVHTQNTCAWCAGAEVTEGNLHLMLDFASQNYQRQTEWFIRHRDHAIVQLGAVITAELAVAELTILEPPAKIVVFLTLTLLSIGFAWAGATSCKRSFMAALESIATINKSLWALGIAGKVRVANNIQQDSDLAPPFPMDKTLLAPRFLEGGEKHQTTSQFVNSLLDGTGFKPTNTYRLSRFSIIVLGLAGAILGIIFCF